MHPEVERFQKLVDADPTDWFQREVFADLLAEHGETEEETYQRWVAARKRGPTKSTKDKLEHYYWDVLDLPGDVFVQLANAHILHPLGSADNAWKRLRVAYMKALEEDLDP